MKKRLRGMIGSAVVAVIVAIAIGLGTIAFGQGNRQPTAEIEMRVWQRADDLERIFVSARPAGGSWATLGTIPWAYGKEEPYEVTPNGRYRYNDITLFVPIGEAEPLSAREADLERQLRDVQNRLVDTEHELDAALARITELESDPTPTPTATPEPARGAYTPHKGIDRNNAGREAYWGTGIDPVSGKFYSFVAVTATFDLDTFISFTCYEGWDDMDLVWGGEALENIDRGNAVVTWRPVVSGELPRSETWRHGYSTSGAPLLSAPNPRALWRAGRDSDLALTAHGVSQSTYGSDLYLRTPTGFPDLDKIIENIERCGDY